MEEVKCVLCGKEARVVRGTPRIEQTCTDHRGQVPPVVTTLREYVNPDELATAVERNAARTLFAVLEEAALEFEAAARVNEQQLGSLRDRFDRERASEFKGERRARLECARHLRRLALQVDLLLSDN